VLEYAVDRAWSAVGEHVVAHLVSLFGMSFEQIMRVSCTDGQPLVYRSVPRKLRTEIFQHVSTSASANLNHMLLYSYPVFRFP